jgi:hypothetical protein
MNTNNIPSNVPSASTELPSCRLRQNLSRISASARIPLRRSEDPPPYKLDGRCSVAESAKLAFVDLLIQCI